MGETQAAEVHGICDVGYEGVRDAFSAGFRDGHDRGASVCLYVDGRRVVDLWGGYADADRTQPWVRDTIVNIWSTTKGLVALSAAMLADRGDLDVDAPVADYWPEFKANGKDHIPVRYLLAHRAGLPGLRAPQLPVEALFDWDRMTELLAAEQPWWEPGTMHGYHAFTYGYLVGELIRRITGKTPGQFLQDEIAGPLGADLLIGLTQDDQARVSAVTKPGPLPEGMVNPLQVAMEDPESLTSRALANPPVVPSSRSYEWANDPAWRAAEIPAANGHGNARGIARVYAALAAGGTLDGVRLLSTAGIHAATTEQSRGLDAITNLPHVWALGFLLELTPFFAPGSTGFGHPGAGGSIGFADPDRGIAFGFAMNSMLNWSPDPRWSTLIPAAYAAIPS